MTCELFKRYSIEQICRDVLECAIEKRIVIFRRSSFIAAKEPQELTAADLVAVANLLRDRLLANAAATG